MGKFRNGELADDSIRLSVDFSDFRSPLRTTLGSNAQLVWSLELKSALRADVVEQWRRWLRDHGTYRFLHFERPIYAAIFRKPGLARSAISQRSYRSKHCCNGEQTAD